MKSKKGFTLIELLIVIAIMSMVMAIGLPSFQSIIASSRLTSAVNAMVGTLQLARMEALKQHKQVMVVPRGTGWESGWNVFVDKDSDESQDADETTLATFDKLSSTLSVTTTASYENYIYYNESGRIKPNAGHFTFCSATDFRSVIIAITGRVRVETISSCN